MSQSAARFFDDPGEAARFAVYRAAQIAEYGTWVAARNLHVDGVLAFTVGHPVPDEHVSRFGWATDGSVIPAGTPLPEPGVDRDTQLRARMATLDAERAAIEAELAADADTDTAAAEPGEPDAKPRPPKAARRVAKSEE